MNLSYGNLSELDEFFAHADDIVADWEGSYDASDSASDETWWLDLPAAHGDEAVRPQALLATDFQAALERRRHRNTGPSARLRLDGRRLRRTH